MKRVQGAESKARLLAGTLESESSWAIRSRVPVKIRGTRNRNSPSSSGAYGRSFESGRAVAMSPTSRVGRSAVANDRSY